MSKKINLDTEMNKEKETNMSKCKIKKEEQNNVGQIQILKKKKDWEPSHKKYYDHMSRWVTEYYKEINLGLFLPPSVFDNPDGNFFWKYDSDGELVDKNGYGICLDGPLSEYNRMVKRKLEYDDLLEIFENGVKYGIKVMRREFFQEEFDFVLGYSNYDEKKRPYDDWLRELMEELFVQEREERKVT